MWREAATHRMPVKNSVYNKSMPHREETEAEYEEDVMEREVPWRVTALRYLLSVLTFCIVIVIVLGGYWIWEDFGAPSRPGQAPPAFTWANAGESLRSNFNEFIGKVRRPCPIAEASTCKTK